MKSNILRATPAISFDKTILAILGLVLLAIAFVILRGDRVGAQIVATYPQGDQTISALGRVGITFKQPMNTKEVEARMKIEPDTPGNFTWEGNTLWFVPQQAWRTDIDYHLQLTAGASSLDGRKVLQDRSVTFQVRPPEILYLSTQSNHLDLASIPASGGSPRKLSAAGADVYDFAPSRDGEQVVYSVKNSAGGADLWLVNRDSSHNHLLINCAADECSQPAWSPDGKHLVYYRKVAQSSNVSTTGVWTADPGTGQTDYIFPGANPSLSPDGNQLVTVDGTAGVIRILNIQTGKGVELQADTDILPAWLPDSSKMIYANLQAAGALTNVALFQVEVNTKQVSRLLDTIPSDADVSMPVIAPDGQNLLIGMRVIGGISSEQLYVMDIHGSHSQKITIDPMYNNASYSWDPWGARAVFQQLQLGVSASAPQVMVWDRRTGKTIKVVDNATLPQWLP